MKKSDKCYIFHAFWILIFYRGKWCDDFSLKHKKTNWILKILKKILVSLWHSFNKLQLFIYYVFMTLLFLFFSFSRCSFLSWLFFMDFNQK